MAKVLTELDPRFESEALNQKRVSQESDQNVVKYIAHFYLREE